MGERSLVLAHLLQEDRAVSCYEEDEYDTEWVVCPQCYGTGCAYCGGEGEIEQRWPRSDDDEDEEG